MPPQRAKLPRESLFCLIFSQALRHTDVDALPSSLVGISRVFLSIV